MASPPSSPAWMKGRNDQTQMLNTDEDDDVPVNGQRRVTMKTVRIAEVVYDVRQYWGLRKLLIDVLILACHFLASNFTYQPLSGEIGGFPPFGSFSPAKPEVLITGIVNGVPDNRPNPLTLFDAGTLSEAIDMLCSSMTYWGQASYGPDDRYMYFGQSSLRVRALVVQIDPLNQCDWGTEVTYPPLCFSDDPAAVAEFSNSSRWVRVEGEAAAPRPSLVRWWYPTGESAGTLHEGFKAGVTPKPDLHFPLLLDEFDRGEFQARIDLLRSKADLVAAYSKFVQLFVVTEHVLTGEISHQRIAFDRSVPAMDSGMLFAATTPRIIVWNSASPVFSWPDRPGVAARPQRIALAFHVASNVLMLFIFRDLVNRFLAVRHHRRCVRMLQASGGLHPSPRRDCARTLRRDNIEALLVILRPFSWTSFDVCVLLYAILFENVLWNAIISVPPLAADSGVLSVADVLQITMHSNSCVVWICSDGVFVACLFFRLFESVFKFRRLAMYVRVFELSFGQFKDYAVIFLSLLMCGSLGFSFVCQGLGGGTGFSNYTAAVNSWSLFVFRFYDYRTFSQDGKWVGFGLPLMGIAFFWVAVILCVIFSQNIILAVIMAAHNAAVGELEESYGLDCQVSFATYCSYRAFQSVGRLFSVAAALSARGGRRRRKGGVGYALGGFVRDLRCLVRAPRASAWCHFHSSKVAPLATAGGAAENIVAAGAAACWDPPAKPDGGAAWALGRTSSCDPPSPVAAAGACAAGSGSPAGASPGALLSRVRLGLSGQGVHEDPLEKDLLDAATAFGLAPSAQPRVGDRGARPRWFPSEHMRQCLARWELIEEAAPILLRLVEFYTNPASGRLHENSPFATVLARQDTARRGGGVSGAGGGVAGLGFGELEIPTLSASLDAHEMALLFSRLRVLVRLGEDYQPLPLPHCAAMAAAAAAAAGGASAAAAGASRLSGGSYTAAAGGSNLSHHLNAQPAPTHVPGGTARSSDGLGRRAAPSSAPGSPSAAGGGGSEMALFGSVSTSPAARGSFDRPRAGAPRHAAQRPSDEELLCAKRLQRLYGSVPTTSTRKPGVQLSTLGQMASIQGQMHRIQRPLRERGWDSFISYSRENAEGQVSELRLDLLMVGHRAWLDLFENSSPEGLFQGIMQSDMFILYLTRGVLAHTQTQLELAAALEARKLVVLVRECRQQVIYRDGGGQFQNACASVTEVRAEAPPEFHAVFDACVSLEATDYRDVSERRLFIEHLTGGKNAQVVESLFKWTRVGGEQEFVSERLERLSEGLSEGEDDDDSVGAVGERESSRPSDGTDEVRAQASTKISTATVVVAPA